MMKTANVKKITPVLCVQELEPCIEFWTKRLGFQKTVEVPEGDKIGFVILQKDRVELMYQSYSSVEKDNSAMAGVVRMGPTFLYVEVEDLDAVLTATQGTQMVMAVRDTFYGAREFGTKDPAGHYVIFAQQGAAQRK